MRTITLLLTILLLPSVELKGTEGLNNNQFNTVVKK